MSPADPTAKAAIHAGDHDVLGSALARLDKHVANFLVLRDGYEVPHAGLVRLYKALSVQLVPGYDYLRHVNHMLDRGRRKLGQFLSETGVALEGLDWHSSRTVRDIGCRHGVNLLRACSHCDQPKIAIVGPIGRPRKYCSNLCRQAAYRRRQTDRAQIIAR